MPSIEEILANGTSFLPSFQSLIFTLAGLIGLVMLSQGVMTQLEDGRRGQGVQASSLALMLGGAMLWSMFTFSDTIATSIFAASSESLVVEEAVDPGAGFDGETIVKVMVLYLAIVGWIAIFRGILIFGNGPKTNQPGFIRKGLLHVVAGVMLVNYTPLAESMKLTFLGEEGAALFSLSP